MEKQRVYAISPHFTTTDFPGKLTLDNKIDIFVDRISGWQIGIAKEIIKHNIQHSGYAVLQIIMSYFETIGKYSSGYIGDHGSKVNFKIGMKRTFPEIGAEEEEFLNSFYEDVRNGLYHVGLTKTNVVLICDIPGSIGFHQERKQLAICPERLVEDIDIRFTVFSADLRDPKNEELRKNFELRFNYDNSLLAPVS
jgi:hypothetical protein